MDHQALHQERKSNTKEFGHEGGQVSGYPIERQILPVLLQDSSRSSCGISRLLFLHTRVFRRFITDQSYFGWDNARREGVYLGAKRLTKATTC